MGNEVSFTGKTALVLTGPPGIGKTTVIKRVAAALDAHGIRGFTTEEVREGTERVGFRLETFDGESVLFAHVKIRSPHRVSRYGVDLPAFERIVEKALDPAAKAKIYIVDEIGKMECLSVRFVLSLEKLLDSGATVVATVASKGSGLIERVKRREDVSLIRVTRSNRETLSGEVLSWLESVRR